MHPQPTFQKDCYIPNFKNLSLQFIQKRKCIRKAKKLMKKQEFKDIKCLKILKCTVESRSITIHVFGIRKRESHEVADKTDCLVDRSRHLISTGMRSPATGPEKTVS